MKWIIDALASGKAPITFEADGRPLPLGETSRPGGPSPVHYFLVSIAGCFAMSCREALRRRNHPMVDFRVSVGGEKPAEPGNVLGSVWLSVKFEAGVEEGLSRTVVEDAKTICTITNTLKHPPSIQYDSSVAGHTQGAVL